MRSFVFPASFCPRAFLRFEIVGAFQARYRELLEQTDAQSKMEFSKLVRGFVFDLRAKNEVAMDRRRRARANGEGTMLGTIEQLSQLNGRL